MLLRWFRRRHFKRETWFKTVIVVLGKAFGTRLYLRITLLKMAFRNGLYKLSMPTDIDESEIILSYRPSKSKTTRQPYDGSRRKDVGVL